VRARAGVSWQIDSALKAKYDNVFHSLNPQRGRLTGAAARPVLMQSGLPTDKLRQVWELADIDRDGCLDSSEFAVAMFLVEQLVSGGMSALPPRLPATLVPPEKRAGHPNLA
jgi:hypothetical protein